MSGHFYDIFLTVPRIIHREDFHRVLLDKATRLGAEIRINSEVTDIIFERPEVVLAGGQRVAGDVIIGADGKLLTHTQTTSTDRQYRPILSNPRHHPRDPNTPPRNRRLSIPRNLQT